MIDFEIKINNGKAVKTTIDHIAYIKGTKATTKVKKAFRNYLIEKIQQNFSNSSEADGTPWAKLKYRVGKPLILTGAMRRSVKSRNTQNGVSVFTNIYYAGWQNYGTNKIPARRFIPNDNEIPEEWVNDMKQMIINGYRDFTSNDLPKARK